MEFGEYRLSSFVSVSCSAVLRLKRAFAMENETWLGDSCLAM